MRRVYPPLRALYDRVLASPRLRLSVAVTETGARLEDDEGTVYAWLPFTDARPRDATVSEARILCELRMNARGLTEAMLREQAAPPRGVA